MICRFEDRQAGAAIVMDGARDRVCAHDATQLPAVFAAIDQARQAGRWVALLADYELGEWLHPHALLTVAGARPRTTTRQAPRLTMLSFEHASQQAPWQASGDDAQAGVDAVVPALARDDYLANVQAIRGMIGRGELYQLNYTFGLNVATHGSHAALYRVLANRHPSAHAAYIEDEGRTVLSFSPELFLKRTGTRVTTRPMKGTAPRYPDSQADQASAQALQTSVKDRAENLMIVDLLRNDLGRLARAGDVQVDALFTLEAYPSVWTLTSTISAELGATPLAAILGSLFPCGSITGAPKLAAMQQIRALEPDPRGIYCGAIGWLAPDGDFSLNVAIRTLVMDRPDAGVYRVGGGIVHDSDPAMEWEECLWKARVLTS